MCLCNINRAHVVTIININANAMNDEPEKALGFYFLGTGNPEPHGNREKILGSSITRRRVNLEFVNWILGATIGVPTLKFELIKVA